MRLRGNGISTLGLSLKATVQRFAAALLVMTALGLVILGKADAPLITNWRIFLTDAVTPILAVIQQPVQAARNVIAEARAWTSLRAENVQLREENARLQTWRQLAVRYRYENRHLRHLLRMTRSPAPTFISARVVGDSGSPFVRTLLLAAGSENGIVPNQAVIAAGGLVGRIVEVGNRSARILLLTDLNSRVPVRLAGSGYRGILIGNNSPQPDLTYLPARAKAHPGDEVVTSGDGGLFPPGLPVGVVTRVMGTAVQVRPYVDDDKVEFVSVVRYRLTAPKDATSESASVASRQRRALSKQ